MSRLDPLINLPGFHVEKVEGQTKINIFAHSDKKQKCPNCESHEYTIKQTFQREVRHESMGLRVCHLKLTAHRFKCKRCKKSFNERFDGLQAYQRATESFKEEVFHKHNQGVTQRVLQKALHLGHSTIERWYHYMISRKYKERKNNPAPIILGIDEHFFTKKDGYATTFADLRNNRVYDVVLGKSEESLEKYLKSMKGRTKTKLAFMDLSETYRSIVKKYFTHAEIVADRFHVIRLINRHFRKAYLHIEPTLLKTKGIRNLLRYHEWNLSEGDQKKLQRFLIDHSALKALYDYKQNICHLLTRKNQTAKQCRKLIPKFINIITELESSPIKVLRTLGATFRNWQNEIVRIWRYSKTNSITEGLHTKMEMINRRSFGFKKFENYRLRVKVLCG